LLGKNTESRFHLRSVPEAPWERKVPKCGQLSDFRGLAAADQGARVPVGRGRL
jgi:hypothetical protein